MTEELGIGIRYLCSWETFKENIMLCWLAQIICKENPGARTRPRSKQSDSGKNRNNYFQKSFLNFSLALNI